MSYSEYSGFENNSFHSNMRSININEKLGSRCMGDFCFFNSELRAFKFLLTFQKE
jgi:hypothetical protein